MTVYMEVATLDGIDEYSSEWHRAGCALKACKRVLEAVCKQGL